MTKGKSTLRTQVGRWTRSGEFPRSIWEPGGDWWPPSPGCGLLGQAFWWYPQGDNSCFSWNTGEPCSCWCWGGWHYTCQDLEFYTGPPSSYQSGTFMQALFYMWNNCEISFDGNTWFLYYYWVFRIMIFINLDKKNNLSILDNTCISLNELTFISIKLIND